MKHNREEIIFFGKITACITHELQNVLAIIQESSGLMEDQIAFSTDASGPLKDGIEKSLTVVNRQLLRGIGLLTNLNRFAHSPDQLLVHIDLYEVTEQMTILSRRFAALKKVVLINHAPDQPIRFTTNLVQLQLAIFLSIECCLSVLAPGNQIIINMKEHPSDILIQVLCDDNLACHGNLTENLSGTDLWKSLNQTLVKLEGSAEINDTVNGIILSLPILC